MAIRPRSVGEILDGGIRLYRQDMGLYMFTAVVASLPMTLLAVLGVLGSTTGVFVAMAVIFPFAVVGVFALWTALTIQMHERLEGREPALGTSVKRGLSLVLRVIWAMFLAYVVLAGMGAVMALGIGVVSVVTGLVLPGVVAAIVTIVASVAIVIYLGLKVVPGLALFLPSIVVEDLTGYGSLKRGYALSRGGQIRILAVLILSSILIFVPFSATYFLTGTAATLYDPNAMASGMVSTGQLVVQQILGLAATGFTTPFLVACILLLYFDQRVRVEAYDLQAEADALTG